MVWTYDETPDNENTDDVDGGCLTRESLTESGNNDNHELNTV